MNGKLFSKQLTRRQFISAGGVSLVGLAVWNENPSKLGIGDLFNTTCINMTMVDWKVGLSGVKLDSQKANFSIWII